MDLRSAGEWNAYAEVLVGPEKVNTVAVFPDSDTGRPITLQNNALQLLRETGIAHGGRLAADRMWPVNGPQREPGRVPGRAFLPLKNPELFVDGAEQVPVRGQLRGKPQALLSRLRRVSYASLW